MGHISYEKLRSKMKDEGLTTYRIRKEKIISESTLQRIREDGSITTDAIATLCDVLDCQPGDILEYVKD
ncbi:MAG: helix-turn-helix transcriptional regulator [Oscillospiraceae bacterium]|nr:helix-turn-helix transcriptional regulator [Oscillospiraceae bacterium]